LLGEAPAPILGYDLRLLQRGLKVFEDDKKWSDIKAREELVGGGTCYSLAHLRDAEYRFRIPAIGKYPELEIILLLDPAGERREYEIFFRVFRQSSRVTRIFVESAYVRDPHRNIKQPSPISRRDRVSAKILMGKTAKGSRSFDRLERDREAIRQQKAP